jgi:hypothetical protein
MLRSIKEICGDKLGALDGEIGHVKDFYFDDNQWAVRYVVADTGSWITGRLVLLSPHALGRLPAKGKILPVNLTRQQIENCPVIDSHKPISRQYEEEYYRYYGWPYYWEGAALWGMSGFPILPVRPEPFPGQPAKPEVSREDSVDAHLRSAQAVLGYQVQTGQEISGHVVDFAMDDESWVIAHLVVNTGHRFSGNTLMISPDQVDRISWDESKVYLKEILAAAPAPGVPSV